jgi:hypothetical protein
MAFMTPIGDAGLTRTPLRCPHCGRAATASERFFLQSPEGPVQHIKIGCSAGHWLIPHLGPGESRWSGPRAATPAARPVRFLQDTAVAPR